MVLDFRVLLTAEEMAFQEGINRLEISLFNLDSSRW